MKGQKDTPNQSGWVGLGADSLARKSSTLPEVGAGVGLMEGELLGACVRRTTRIVR